MASLVAQLLKNLPAMQETWVIFNIQSTKFSPQQPVVSYKVIIYAIFLSAIAILIYRLNYIIPLGGYNNPQWGWGDDIYKITKIL